MKIKPLLGSMIAPGMLICIGVGYKPVVVLKIDNENLINTMFITGLGQFGLLRSLFSKKATYWQYDI